MEEIEVKYIIPLSCLKTVLDLCDLPVQKLSQSYFSRQYIKEKMIPLIHTLRPDLEVPENFDYKNGRVRSVEEEGRTSSFLTLKGPRDNSYSRLEIEFEIENSLYNDLLAEADRGTVKKLRHFLKGELLLSEGNSCSVIAQIDIVTEAAGQPFEHEGIPSFAIVEVELESEALIALFRDGKHTFGFLEDAVEILTLEREIQKPIRMRDLARYGITPELFKALGRVFNKQSERD